MSQIETLKAEIESLKAELAEKQKGTIVITGEISKKIRDSAEQFKTDQYNANRRAKRAGDKQQQAINTPVPDVPVPATPERLRKMFGDVVKVPPNRRNWISNHTKLWSELQSGTRVQYLANAVTAFEKAGYVHSQKFTEPIGLMNFILNKNIDFWKVVIFATDLKQTTQNMSANYAKALLGCINEKLRNVEYGHYQEPQLAQWAQMCQVFNGDAKRVTADIHENQGQSELAKANTIPWPEWTALSKTEIEKYPMKDASIPWKDKRNALILAVYSMMPPIRRNWSSVRVVDKAPPMSDERRENCIVIKDGEPVCAYWSDFKNRESFLKELPLRNPIKNKTLVTMLREYANILNSDYLFPSSNTAQSKPLTPNTFGTLIGNLTNELTGKRFTVNRLRASFITDWHPKNQKDGILIVHKTTQIMRELHQKNIGTHLNYAKILDENLRDLYQKGEVPDVD